MTLVTHVERSVTIWSNYVTSVICVATDTQCDTDTLWHFDMCSECHNMSYMSVAWRMCHGVMMTRSMCYTWRLAYLLTLVAQWMTHGTHWSRGGCVTQSRTTLETYCHGRLVTHGHVSQVANVSHCHERHQWLVTHGHVSQVANVSHSHERRVTQSRTTLVTCDTWTCVTVANVSHSHERH